MPRYIVEGTVITPHRFAITAENETIARWKVEDYLSMQLAHGDFVEILDSWEAGPFDGEQFYDEDLDEEA